MTQNVHILASLMKASKFLAAKGTFVTTINMSDRNELSAYRLQRALRKLFKRCDSEEISEDESLLICSGYKNNLTKDTENQFSYNAVFSIVQSPTKEAAVVTDEIIP